MPVAKVATRSMTACSGMPAGQGLVAATLTQHVEFEAEVLGSLGGGRTGKLLDVADALLVLVHVGFVDQQVVAAGFLEAQPGVFGVVRQQFFHSGLGCLDCPHDGLLAALDGRVVQLGA